ncbi:protoporphyrinogen oxidase chloroplastic [Raphidocelis subcapitata]|uniref:Protoporphyrinogen oxidase n=1 Tax=Raphidocelis subcapitata TaxID=307507 RepID=A0A2V0PQH5_9CHLO|nr:protoporphyrinogen oxidase chloroplastic [Raphidocelis subcapitata]|eukprot:GBG00321.1 protoporphyrinogen oxidase chloroplastic [Raphidocelis subcapitata]
MMLSAHTAPCSGLAPARRPCQAASRPSPSASHRARATISAAAAAAGPWGRAESFAAPAGGIAAPAAAGPRRAARRAAVAAAAAASPDGVLDTVIVGAGISGLVTAQALATRHAGEVGSFLVTEARERVGGNITSMAGGGYVWEEGPNSFQPNDSMLAAAVDAGVADKLVFGDPTAPRFVFWEKKLRPTPSGLDAVTFDLMSLWGKIRAGLGAVGIANGSMPESEESVEQFIRRNLGAEVFERLIEPFCSGVYAGDPSKLSMKAAFNRIWILEKMGGSLVGGAIKLFQDRKANPPPPRDPRLPPKPKGQTVGSFREGLKTLPEAIGAKLADRVRCNWKLTSISRDAASGVFTLRYDTPSGPAELRARSVAMTLPAWALADLIKAQAPAAAGALASFDYPPVAAVTLAYPNSAVREDRKAADGTVPGFGQLHPRSQGVTTLGTIYSSSLFPGRAPSDEIMLLNYIGGATNRGVKDATTEQLAAQVDKDLRTMLLKPDAPQPRIVGVRVWPRAIPQFNVGHLDVLDTAKKGLSSAGLEGVLLGGNYVSGVALGKCVEYGFEFAGEIAKYVAANKAGSGAAEAAAPPREAVGAA